MSENHKWILSLIREEMLSEAPLEEDVSTTVKPKSRIQEILKEFYEELSTAESADALDKFYEEKLKDYPQIHRFSLFIEELGKKLDLDIQYPYLEKDFQEAFFKIAEKRIEEPATLEVVREAINSKYPNLVSEINVDVSAEGLRKQYENYVEEELEKIRKKLEKGEPIEIEKYLKKIRKAKKTEIEEIAYTLNNIIILGKETWELILYSIMSPYAPTIKINNLPTRPNLHTLLIGDISTAKSKVNSIVEKIAPKAVRISKSTEASFEGVAKQETIEKGIIDYANNGVLVIPEFSTAFEQFQILREVMDCGTITIVKGGNIKRIPINISFLGGSNPKEDFFQNDMTLREQINFKDGLLSRFDILIPMLTTTEKNEMLLDQIDIFSTNHQKLSLDDIKERLETLSKGMMNIVTEVRLSSKQKQMIKSAFLRHNTNLQNRPLLILRDLETLCRIVNVVVAINFSNRTVKDGIVYAKDIDIEKAIELWEELITLRKLLYTSKRRLVFSIKEKILMEIARNGNRIKPTELKEILVREGYCSARTVERKINELIREGKIIKVGKRDGILSLTTIATAQKEAQRNIII